MERKGRVKNLGKMRKQTPGVGDKKDGVMRHVYIYIFFFCYGRNFSLYVMEAIDNKEDGLLTPGISLGIFICVTYIKYMLRVFSVMKINITLVYIFPLKSTHACVGWVGYSFLLSLPHILSSIHLVDSSTHFGATSRYDTATAPFCFNC